jgi:hypothetical protein
MQYNELLIDLGEQFMIKMLNDVVQLGNNEEL